MKLDMRKMLSGETDSIDIDYTLSASELPEIDGVEFSSDVHVTGKLTNTAGYMRLELVCAVDYATACARCLKDVKDVFNVSFDKTVCEEGDLQNHENDDYIEICDGVLDIDAALIEDIILNFPMRILCNDECKGLCPKCGIDLNTENCSCVTKEIDPRLAPLLKFFENND